MSRSSKMWAPAREWPVSHPSKMWTSAREWLAFHHSINLRQPYRPLLSRQLCRCLISNWRSPCRPLSRWWHHPGPQVSRRYLSHLSTRLTSLSLHQRPPTRITSSRLTLSRRHHLSISHNSRYRPKLAATQSSPSNGPCGQTPGPHHLHRKSSPLPPNHPPGGSAQ